MLLPGDKCKSKETGEGFIFIRELSGGLAEVKSIDGRVRYIWAGHLEQVKESKYGQG